MKQKLRAQKEKILRLWFTLHEEIHFESQKAIYYFETTFELCPYNESTVICGTQWIDLFTRTLVSNHDFNRTYSYRAQVSDMSVCDRQWQIIVRKAKAKTLAIFYWILLSFLLMNRIKKQFWDLGRMLRYQQYNRGTLDRSVLLWS